MDARVKEIEARLKEAVDPEYSGRESIALRASVADIPYLLTALREVLEREKKLVAAAEKAQNEWLKLYESHCLGRHAVRQFCPVCVDGRSIYAAVKEKTGK